LTKCNIPFVEADGIISISDFEGIQHNAKEKEWKEFWENHKDALSHLGTFNPTTKVATWEIKLKCTSVLTS